VATIAQQPRPTSPAKHDVAVEAYLARARRRIRGLDGAVGGLVLVCATLAFALAMVFGDRWLVLSPLTRQLALASFGLAALLYAAFGLLIPLCRRINPYYAARHLEQVVPGAKNSVVNWLDLHDEPLPPAIRAALGQRAARDLANADLEQAINGRRVAWAGGLAAALAVAALVAMAVLGARPFVSLLGRTFAPFSEGLIATRTRLTLLQPEGGDVTVAVGRPVRFGVAVDGRVPQPGKPDAIRLLFHYQPGDPYEERPLERENSDQWTMTLPAFQVQNGFWYKVAGGDTETPEYRVQVRATPLINGFDATYHYRPYLGWRDDTTHDPNLRALRGTEVRLVAHTNRTVRVKDSRLEWEVAAPTPGPGAAGSEKRPAVEAAKLPEAGKKAIAAAAVPDDPQALAFRFVLEESGKYRVWFTSTEGESNTEPMAYSVQVLPDHAPQVELTKPGQDVRLPVNGLLQLEGVANDDIGVKSLTLQLRLAGGPELRPQPYRAGKSFKLDDGGYPKTLPYKDFVELAKIKDADGKPAGLQPKMVLEYWLEAHDDCDYPGPNVGRSHVYKVTLGEPDADRKRQEQEQKKAEQDQQQHEAKQDQQLKQENQNPHQETNPDHAQQNQPDPGKNDSEKPDTRPDGNKPGDKANEQPKPGEQPGQKPEQQPKPGEQPDKGDKNGQQNAGQNADSTQPGKQDGREQKAEQLAKAVQNQPGQHGEAKSEPAQEPKGENKDPGQSQQGKTDARGAAQSKEGGPSGAQKPDTGANKDPGGPSQPHPQAGAKKDPGSQGEAAGQKPPQGEAKHEPEAAPHGEKKEPGKPGGAGQERSGTPKEPGHDQASAGPKAENKPAEEKNNSGGSPHGEAKDHDTPKDPGAASPRDVQSLEQKLRDGSQREQQAAQEQLEQVGEKAKDPAARDAAKKALEKHAQEKKESSPGASKPQPKPPSSPKDAEQSCPCKCKNGSGNSNPEAGGSKGSGSGQGKDQKGTAKGEGARQTARTGAEQGNSEDGSGKKNDSNSPGSAKSNGGQGQQGNPGEGQTGGTGGGGTPGEHIIGGRNDNIANQEPPPAGPAPTPERQGDPEKSRHAGELVLEDLRKTLEELKKHPEEMKKVLNRAGLKEKDVRDVEDYLNEKLPPPQQIGSLHNLGVHQVGPGKGSTTGAKVAAPALPPPGFRDSSREFSRQLAQPDKD
jgi:collagen type III alpha